MNTAKEKDRIIYDWRDYGKRCGPAMKKGKREGTLKKKKLTMCFDEPMANLFRRFSGVLWV
jgi:hypothetical protein